jgi:alpha-tubulin suppressor-like RCC1 family protein
MKTNAHVSPRWGVICSAGIFRLILLAWLFGAFLTVGSAATNVRVSAGYSYCLSLENDESVSAWGYDIFGELGNATTTDSWIPEPVGGLGAAVAVSAGYVHSLALTADGHVWAWGYNYYGELGNGTTINLGTFILDMKSITSVLARGLPTSACQDWRPWVGCTGLTQRIRSGF